MKSAIKKISVFLPLNETDQSVQSGDRVLYSGERKKKSLQTKWMPNFSVFYSPSHPKIEIFMAGGVGKTARPVWELRVNPGKQSAHISRKRNIKSLCLETPNTLDTLYF